MALANFCKFVFGASHLKCTDNRIFNLYKDKEMCNSRFFSFVLAVALVAMVTVNPLAGQIKKPSEAQAAVPAPVATPEEEEKVKYLTSEEFVNYKTAIRDSLAAQETKIGELRTQIKQIPAPATVFGAPVEYAVYFIILIFAGVGITYGISKFWRAGGKVTSIMHMFALLLVAASYASAAVTLTKVEPAQFKAGSSGTLTLCTKAGIYALRVAGSNVIVDASRAVESGDCVSNIAVAVDATAAPGKRMIEVLETAGGTFAPTGSEIEIIAAPAPTPTPSPTAPPSPAPAPAKPTVDPEIVKLRRDVAALKLTVEGLCSADAEWKKDAWGSRKGTSVAAGQLCRNGIKHETIEAAVSDDRLKKGLSDALAAFGSYLPTEGQVRLWAADEASRVADPIKSEVATLRKDVDEQKGLIGKLRTDMEANTAATAEVKDKAEYLRSLLAAKGNRGVKNALKEPKQAKPQKGKPAPQPSAAKPVMTPAQP